MPIGQTFLEKGHRIIGGSTNTSTGLHEYDGTHYTIDAVTSCRDTGYSSILNNVIGSANTWHGDFWNYTDRLYVIYKGTYGYYNNVGWEREAD